MAQLLDPEQWGRGPQAGDPDESSADRRPPGPRRTGSSPVPDGPPAASASTTAAAARERRTERAPEPRRGSTPTGPPGGRSRLPLILTVVLVVLAIAAGGVWAAASGLLPFGGAPEGDGGAAPETSAPATGEPEPSPTATAPAEPSGTAVPASCDELYSDGMRGQLDGFGLALNPEWVLSAEPGPPAAEADLTAILTAAENLDCYWVRESGPSDVGIATAVTAVSPEQATTVESALESAGYTVIEELGSRRFVKELGSADGPSGFSHIVRDGLWFATQWSNAPVSGYTADMVNSVLG